MKNKTPESKHTPGPWKYHLGRGANPRFHIQTNGGYQVAMTTELVAHPQAHEENEAREANARIIAAAPELLEVSKMTLRVVENLARSQNTEIYRLLRSAIAKAEGRE